MAGLSRARLALPGPMPCPPPLPPRHYRRPIPRPIRIRVWVTSGARCPARWGVLPSYGAASSPRPGARVRGPAVGSHWVRLVLSPRLVRHGGGRVVGDLSGPPPPLKRKPHPGIPLTADFKAEYDRIASEYAPTLDASGLLRFSYSSPKIQRSISPRRFYLRRLSPWAITPGEGACSVTGLTRRIRDGLTWRYSPEPLCALPRIRGHLRT